MTNWSLSFRPLSIRLPHKQRQKQMKKSLQPYACATVGGMLSSSCCLLQLALNSMSLGCAGFSTLTPYRPLFLLLTAAGLGYEHTLHRSLRRSLAAVVVALSLTVTPQLVELYNRLPSRFPRLPWPASPKELSQQTVTLRLQGVKCESCAARIKNAVLSGDNGVEACTVDFRSGLVEVAGRGVQLPAVHSTLEGLGYTSPEVVPPEQDAKPAVEQGVL